MPAWIRRPDSKANLYHSLDVSKRNALVLTDTKLDGNARMAGTLVFQRDSALRAAPVPKFPAPGAGGMFTRRTSFA